MAEESTGLIPALTAIIPPVTFCNMTGATFKDIRKNKLKWSQEQLAEAMGVTRTTIIRYERPPSSKWHEPIPVTMAKFISAIHEAEKAKRAKAARRRKARG